MYGVQIVWKHIYGCQQHDNMAILHVNTWQEEAQGQDIYFKRLEELKR